MSRRKLSFLATLAVLLAGVLYKGCAELARIDRERQYDRLMGTNTATVDPMTRELQEEQRRQAAEVDTRLHTVEERRQARWAKAHFGYWLPMQRHMIANGLGGGECDNMAQTVVAYGRDPTQHDWGRLVGRQQNCLKMLQSSADQTPLSTEVAFRLDHMLQALSKIPGVEALEQAP